MKARPVLATVFVVCCLLLCGLILRRQIAAHPLPPEVAEREVGGRMEGPWMREMGGWQPAPPALHALAHQTVVGQLVALRAGQGAKAWSYQSQRRRQNFGNPSQFMEMISAGYPAFVNYRNVEYGPVMTDHSGKQAQALIRLEDGQGNQVRAIYHLAREAGEFKVEGVETMSWPGGRR